MASLLRRALDSVGLGIIVCDARREDQPIVSANAAFEELTGHPVSGILTTDSSWISLLGIDPTDPGLQQLAASGEAVVRARRKDGSLFWDEIHAHPLPDASGEPAHVVLVHSDVSARRQAENILLEEREILRMLAEGRPLQSVLDALTRKIEALAPASQSSILLLEGSRVRHCSAPTLPRAYLQAIDGLAIGPDAGSCGSAAYLGKTVVAEDVETDPRWVAYRDLIRPFGLRACWSVPIKDEGGKVLGTFALYYRTPRAPSDVELRTVEAAAAMAGFAIERSRYQSAVRESARRLSLAQQAGEFVLWDFVADPGAFFSDLGRIPFLGYSPGELRSDLATWRALIHPDDLSAVEQKWRQLTDSHHDIEYRVRASNGEWHWILERGAPEYLPDGTLARISGILIDITARKQAEETIRQNEAFFRAIAEQTPESLLLMEVDGDDSFRVIYANDNALRQHGWERGSELRVDAAAAFGGPTLGEERIRRVMDGEVLSFECYAPRAGRTASIEVVCRKLVFGGREVLLYIERDNTDQRRLEEQLRQAQKMEALGRLAGGIAHDFNNLLTVITGFTELALMRGGPDDASRSHLEQVREAAHRAASLSQQLLTFSRRQVIHPEVLDPNEVVAGLAPLLKRLIGEHIALEVKPGDFTARVLMDRVQLGQVLINLAANARDAMPEGGRLTITTSLFSVAERKSPDVRFTVQDTGTGIEESHLHRIFDPFFTTKELGHGTGLGLATVYGIVEQAGGFVTVESPQGKGATFHVHLPAYEAGPAEQAPVKNTVTEASESRVILIAEDEPQILQICRMFLEKAGYRILQASNGHEALTVARSFQGEIHLLLSDMIMPGMGGRELARILHAERPSMQVMFMTGYPPDSPSWPELEQECILQKPLTRKALLAAVAGAFASSSP